MTAEEEGQKYWMWLQAYWMYLMCLCMYILLKKHLNTQFTMDDIQLAGDTLTQIKSLALDHLAPIKEKLDPPSEPEEQDHEQAD